jgi:V8-like Glu-specific endopeptidase
MAGKDQVNSGSGLMEAAYLTKMMRSVVYIEINNPELGYGSGCIVGLPDSGPMLLACHHLLSSKDVARNSTIYFDCENRDSPGVGVSGAELFDLSSEHGFMTNLDLDYALIAMNPSQIPGEERERLDLHHYQRVSTLKEMDIVHLFHYPLVDGVPTLHSSAGTVKFLSGYLLGYCIESAPGSAGGPVVKEVGGTWVVVGLHRGALVFNNSETKVATLVEAIHRTVVDVSYIPEEPDLKKIQLASALDDKPSEIQLISVSREVGGKWKAVLVNLEIKKNKIDSILQTTFGDVENACFEGLVYWRSGNASQPVTWKTLFESLRKSGLEEETKELKKTFNFPLDAAEDVEQESRIRASASRIEKEFCLRNLMPYMTDLSGCGLELAIMIEREGEWEGLQQSPGRSKDHVIKLLKAWLDDSEKPASPHTWEFFINTVRDVGKGKLADKIEAEKIV